MVLNSPCPSHRAVEQLRICGHERDPYLRPADLRDLYRLTPTEAKVALLIIRGPGLQFVADELRVSLSTVGTLENTGTHRRARSGYLSNSSDRAREIGNEMPKVRRTVALGTSG
jgi:hypothetical protein